MSSTTNITYTNSANYTFDSSKIAISGGLAKLLDHPSQFGDGNGSIASTYTTDKNLNWSIGGGSLVTTLSGSAAVAGGLLDMSNASADAVTIVTTNNITFTQTGTIRIKWIPRYTSAPAANQSLYFQRLAAGNKNWIQIQHKTDQSVTVDMRDSSGVVKLAVVFGTFAAVNGTAVEFEFNFDADTGAHRFFVNGTQLGSTNTTTFTRTTELDTAFFGHIPSPNTEFDIVEWSFFDTVQHTTTYTPGEVVPEIRYNTDDPTIITQLSTHVSDLENFVETVTKTGSDNVKYTILVNGVQKYNNGGSVATSDGTYAQSNTAAEIVAIIGDFFTTRATIDIVVFLHSDDGRSTPSLDNIDITFNSALAAPSVGDIVELEGFIYDLTTPVNGVVIKVRPYAAGFVLNNSVFQEYKYITFATTNTDGHFENNIPVQPSGKFWEFLIGTQSYKVRFLKTSGLVDWSNPAQVEITTVVVD